MNWKTIMSKAPNGVIAVCVTVFLCVVVLSFAALAWKSGDMSELRSLINTLFNVATLILSGGALVVGGAAARSADQAARQTNGELDKRIRDAIGSALATQDTKRDASRSAGAGLHTE